MHKFFTASYDASVYLQQPEQNAGRDQLLEVGKLYYGDTKDIARTLIKFPISEISNIILEESASLASSLLVESASVSVVSSSWYTAVSTSLHYSSSYSQSYSNLQNFIGYTETYTELSESVAAASASVSALEKAIIYVSEMDYLSVSSSYAHLSSSAIVGSLTDLQITSDYTAVSASRAKYLIDSATLINQQTELNLLNTDWIGYRAGYNQKLYFQGLSAAASQSWHEYVLLSNELSQSYNAQSASLASDISNGVYRFNYKTFLNLKAANSEEIPLEYTIYANAVSQSWTMGTGTKFDNVNSDGVSWKYRNGTSTWQDNVTGGTAVFTTGTTGSANAEGGTWYIANEASQSYSYEIDDVRMDITGIISLWVSGSLPNNGLIVHHSLNNEENGTDYGVLKFFSKETNTIYQPKLEMVWDDSIFNTGSLSPVTGSASDSDYKVVVTNLKKEYLTNEKSKIRIKGRDMYPSKAFGTTFEYDQSKYLPETTYYQLEDYRTGEIIFPFGNYTKVSCDSTSNYFILDLATLPMNRTYKIKIKIVENGISTIIDDKIIFEIV